MGLNSSGAAAFTVESREVCLACDWEGTVDAVIDRETNLYTWTCPDCTTVTEESFR